MTVLSNRFSFLLAFLLGIYLALYPGSLLVVAFDRVPTWGEWFGGLIILLQGSLCGLWLIANYGRGGLLAALAVLILSFGIEYIGVVTGIPFGAYEYTDTLPLKLFGAVPVVIPFAWLLVVPASLETARYIHRPTATSRGVGPLTLTMASATMAMLLDAVLEPVVTLVNGYWIWLEGSNYYGVPMANFAAWWVTALVLTGITQLFIRGASQPRIMPQLPLWLYLLSMLMFTLVNLSHGYVAAAAIGGLILSYLLFVHLEWRLVRWVLSGRVADQTPG